MDFEAMKDQLQKELGGHPWLTLKNLATRLDQPRKRVCFVLQMYSDDFQQFYRNPANVVGRKRPVWKLKKIEEDIPRQE
jgi:hypothetical protein